MDTKELTKALACIEKAQQIIAAMILKEQQENNPAPMLEVIAEDMKIGETREFNGNLYTAEITMMKCAGCSLLWECKKTQKEREAVLGMCLSSDRKDCRNIVFMKTL